MIQFVVECDDTELNRGYPIYKLHTLHLYLCIALDIGLTFESVLQLQQHQRAVAGGVDLWGQPDGQARRCVCVCV